MKKLALSTVLAITLFVVGNANASLIISQIYGGGGATTGTPTYNHDYIVLYNNGAASVDLAGWSIQYASATGNFGSTNMHSLSGDVGADSYFLIQESNPPGTPGTTGANLPITPDYNGQLNLSATSGKVALVNSMTVVPGTGSTGGYVDLIGYGTSANYNNGKPLTGALDNTKAVFQDITTGALSVGAPVPMNSETPSPVPIPAAVWLFGSGLAGLVGIRKRSRASM